MNPAMLPEENPRPDKKAGGDHLETITSHFNAEGNNSKDDSLAKQATVDEHVLTLIQALRQYPKAVT